MNTFYTIQNWSGSQAYKQHDCVIYENKYYFALKDNAGIVPTNSDFWFSENYFVWKASSTSSINGVPFNRFAQVPNKNKAYHIEPNENKKNFFNINLDFLNRSDEECKSILTFLELNSGTKKFFYEIPSPYNEVRNFICKTWSHNHIFYDNNSINATFEEVL